MEDELLAAFLDFLTDLETVVRQAKEKLAKTVLWNVVNAPRPCNVEDPAIKWLARKLEEIKSKHPELKWEWVKNADNLVTGLRFIVDSEEAADDVQSVANWAFVKASQRPQTGKNV
jgi:hypothetical protein